MAKRSYPQYTWHPAYWPTHAVILLLKLLAWLPWPLKISTGRTIGRLAYLFARQRRHYTEINIALCFPEKTPQQQRELVQETFISNGIGLVEVATCLVRDVSELKERVTFLGREHMEQALAQGKGVLVLGAHFSMLDLGGALHTLFYPGDAIYKPHKNPVMDAFIQRGRLKHYEQMVPQKDLKALVRRIRQGKAVWYSPDQDFGRKVSVFAPFFGVTAATVTMTARIAKMTGAPVLPLRMHRNADQRSYTLEYLPPLEDFPSDDPLQDATRVNQVLEQMIRLHPEQYLWMHRRFKTQADPSLPSPYKRSSSRL